VPKEGGGVGVSGKKKRGLCVATSGTGKKVVEEITCCCRKSLKVSYSAEREKGRRTTTRGGCRGGGGQRVLQKAPGITGLTRGGKQQKEKIITEKNSPTQAQKKKPKNTTHTQINHPIKNKKRESQSQKGPEGLGAKNDRWLRKLQCLDKWVIVQGSG